jgi:hypothetical protein
MARAPLESLAFKAGFNHSMMLEASKVQVLPFFFFLSLSLSLSFCKRYFTEAEGCL